MIDDDGQPQEWWPTCNERPRSRPISIFDADGTRIGFDTDKTKEGRPSEKEDAIGGEEDAIGGEEDPAEFMETLE